MTTENRNILYCHDLSFSYQKSTHLIRNLELTIYSGKFTGVVGPNGSGKSTLAKLFAGMLKPHLGTISSHQIEMPPGDLLLTNASPIAVILADPENQLIAPTVRDELAFSLQVYQLDPKTLNARVEAALDRFHLTKYQDIHPFFLSVGEQFRLLIAAALVRTPHFLILDEVFSMLDTYTRLEITDILLSLKEDFGLGVVLITHRLEDLLSADTIIVFCDGMVAAQGSVDEIFAAASVNPNWGIEVPAFIQLRPPILE